MCSGDMQLGSMIVNNDTILSLTTYTLLDRRSKHRSQTPGRLSKVQLNGHHHRPGHVMPNVCTQPLPPSLKVTPPAVHAAHTDSSARTSPFLGAFLHSLNQKDSNVVSELLSESPGTCNRRVRGVNTVRGRCCRGGGG